MAQASDIKLIVLKGYSHQDVKCYHGNALPKAAESWKLCTVTLCQDCSDIRF